MVPQNSNATFTKKVKIRVCKSIGQPKKQTKYPKRKETTPLFPAKTRQNREGGMSDMRKSLILVMVALLLNYCVSTQTIITIDSHKRAYFRSMFE